MTESPAVEALKLRLARATSKEERKTIYGRIRSRRLAEARARGTHSSQQWMDLVSRFDMRCVRCGCYPEPHPCKDHIVPIFMGGSDAIENLQPLCRECNSSKTVDQTNWVAYRDLHGFLDIDQPEPRF